VQIAPRKPLVVGSFGDPCSLASADPEAVRGACDLVEVRLDLMSAGEASGRPWRHLGDAPLLFTARRGSEGGGGELSADERRERLTAVLDDASLVDLEVASIAEMEGLIQRLGELGIPWIGSYHDFRRVPPIAELSAARDRARRAGAVAFKAALELGWDGGQLGPLGLFLSQAPDYPVSLMGMGPLAPVSRLYFAQLGSVLNYGYLGSTPTAPGQWSALQLKAAIDSVEREREA